MSIRQVLLIAVLLLSFACSSSQDNEEGTDTSSQSDQGVLCEGDDPGIERPQGWEVDSHCSKVDPNYDLLFVDDVVHRFDITVSPKNYETTMNDLSEKLSGGGPGADADGVADPIWVPVTVEFDGKTWTQVGMRYKGNSSLRSAWQSGIRKLAFRFNFEYYEFTYPEISNQRFYGFQKMTFSNAYKDSSFIRDKVAGEIFRDGGIPAARAAFARVYVDFGEGPTYFGLYTMIEDPSDQMLDAQFGDDSGNLYKPEGDGAAWSDSSLIEEHFDKKTNWEDPDFSDVTVAMSALHADRTDAQAWRDGLEATFHVPTFIKNLAINQAMENWDSYGFMPHNYYVYGDPNDGGRLSWFPWDLNESMLEREVDGIDAGSVMLDEISDQWPLIRFLLDDPQYRELYQNELEAALEGPFAVDKIHAKIQAYQALIEPFVIGDDGETAPYSFLKNEDEFTASGEELETHVEKRHASVQQALGRYP